MERRLDRVGWWAVAVLAASIAAYGLAFAALGERMFQGELAASFQARELAIRLHAVLGALALLLGPLQLRRSLLLARRGLHRGLGKLYVGAALGTGGSGLFVALYAYGGWTTRLGFGLLGAGVLLCTGRAYRLIRARDVAAHREWMIRSYALICAAVTLRIELPLLAAAFGGFLPGYRIVAWSCWVPNLVLAELSLRRGRPQHAARARALLPGPIPLGRG
jgi:uncharacterized membrane protein